MMGLYGTPPVNYLDDEERLPILADEDTWTRYMTRYPVGDVCKADCDLMYREHYHCITGNIRSSQQFILCTVVRSPLRSEPRSDILGCEKAGKCSWLHNSVIACQRSSAKH